MWYGPKGIDDYLMVQQSPLGALENLEASARDLEGLMTIDHRNEVLGALRRTGRLPRVAEASLITIVAKRSD